MSRHVAAWLAWTIWTVTLAMTVPTLLFQSVNVGKSPLAINILGSLVFLAYATVGALVGSRRPRNPLGWILATSALLSVFGDLALEYAVYGLLTRPGSLPAAAWVAPFGEVARTIGFFSIL